MTYRILASAQVDVFDTIDWYNARAAGLGQKFAERFATFVTRILTQPRCVGWVRRGVAGREIREGMLRNFPYRVVFEVAGSAIVILSVTHAHAKTRPWRRRLPPAP